MTNVEARVQASVKSFNEVLDRFVKKQLPDLVVDIHRKVSLQVLNGVVMKTPVDTGRARGGWQTDVAGVVQTQPSLDPLGTKVILDGAQALRSLPFGSNVRISNNVEYITFLENGSSKQAPNGMVVLTLQEVAAQF